MVNIRTYVKRAYEAEAFSNDQVRNESNAFHHLIVMLEYLADVSTMNGHQKRNWGTHVIKRLGEIVADYEAGKKEGKEIREAKQ